MHINSSSRMLRSIAAGMFVAMAALIVQPGDAHADYPDHTITVIVPFDVGGATDILGRMMSTGLSAALGQPVVVENKPGAGAIVGTQYLVGAKPDGYTLLFSSTAATESPAMYPHTSFDPLKDVKPVALFAQAPFLVAVSTEKIKATTLKDFIDLVRQNPGKFNAASGGTGTTLSVDLFLLKNNLSAVILPYPSAGAAVTALASGEADFAILDGAPLGPFISSGKIRALAVTANQRLAAFPDVPTATEAGLPDYEDTATAGMYIRSDVPADIVQKLNAAIHAIVATSDTTDRLRRLGWTPITLSVDQSNAQYLAGIAQWKDIVQRAHIKPLN
jgi:tripartite-type tricarboxylate transporter receptor subunit TctC